MAPSTGQLDILRGGGHFANDKLYRKFLLPLTFRNAFWCKWLHWCFEGCLPTRRRPTSRPSRRRNRRSRRIWQLFRRTNASQLRIKKSRESRAMNQQIKLLTLLEPQHGRPFDRRVPLVHETNQLLQKVRFLLGVLLA